MTIVQGTMEPEPDPTIIRANEHDYANITQLGGNGQCEIILPLS